MSMKFFQPRFLADGLKKIRDLSSGRFKGFSLAEMLVVIAIVSILVLVFLPNIFNSQAAARDSSRAVDLSSFKTGLKLYKMMNHGYPTTTDWISIEADVDSNGPFSQALGNKNFLPKIPRDPAYTAGGEYSYKYIATTTDRYILCAKNEAKLGYSCIDQNESSVVAQVAVVPGFDAGGGGGGEEGCGTVSYGGHDYSTVVVGSQCWLAENLNVGTRLDAMPEAEEGDWQWFSCQNIEKYCYDNNDSNCDSDGGLYQWHQAMCGDLAEGAQGICPSGWHVPTNNEWSVLENYLKDSGTCSSGRTGWDCFGAGTKIKSGSLAAVLSGYRIDHAEFALRGSMAAWWSSLPAASDASEAWIRQVETGGSNDVSVLRINKNRYDSHSVRCIKGDEAKTYMASVTSIASDGYHSCAVSSGSVYCSGYNHYGQLGNGATSEEGYIPVRVKGEGGAGYLTGVSEVGTGWNHSCALKSDGTVWCWGQNLSAQLGDGTTINKSVPVQVLGAGGIGKLTGVSQLSVGDNHNCAIKNDNTIWCWGYNWRGQLGDNTTTQRTSPVQVLGAGGIGKLTGVSQASLGDNHSCAVKTDGTVWCWGYNNAGVLGTGDTTSSRVPIQVLGEGGVGKLTGISQVSAGESNTCAVKPDGTVYCWGWNYSGQLGTNNTTLSYVPIQPLNSNGVGNLTGVSYIFSGQRTTCVIKTDKTLWCWGNNDSGRLGINNTTEQHLPVQVLDKYGSGYFADTAKITGKFYNLCAVKTDGTAYCWGENNKGELMISNMTYSRYLPTQVSRGESQ
ncbi:MAG: FISUMP domain-containing protein [Candidatus Paceibacterota bacterium]